MTAEKWFLGFLKKYKWLMVLGLVMTTVISVLAIVNPHISGLIVDDVIKGGNYDELPYLAAILIGVTAVRSVLRFFYQVVFETCSQGVLYEMRDTVYRKFMQEDFAFYNMERTGDLMSRQTGDMDAVRHFVAYVIYAVYENVLLLIFAIIKKYKVKYKIVTGEIMDKLNGKFPKTLPLSEQGKFIIGYYQQTQDFYKKKEDKEI